MVKMRDVAKLSNVSVATVSRVLHNPETVKEATRNKVLSVIDELNYKPNMLARQFRRNETNIILVVVPSITNTVFSGIIEGIEYEAANHGYRVLLGNTNRKVENEYNLVDLLKKRQTDGMILLSERMDPNYIKSLSEEYPLVLATAYIEGLKVPSVSIDNVSSSREAVEHLIRLGHREIAHITGPLQFAISKGRYNGYRQALMQNNIEVRNMLVQEGDFTFESGYNQMMKLLAIEKAPTAIFAANDEMAMGAVKAAKELRFDVPRDIAVVGFDNITFSSKFDPAITTVAQPLFEMGQKSMKLLLQQIQGKPMLKSQYILDCDLIVRDSCGGKIKEKVMNEEIST
ncbi:LacI family repressor for deo operon, udp, cdd, tsx, nupC, and nupG [Metabacillus crassostreae]|uniref:LacI family DNA-binding transcriptional regulator n=1 Tax=Metabacillus crassostreae TaxID=929098 RepID=UPI00195C48F2|nr:LacI family DNA-binding transcriptional regulator [Metabacillus crassostreae]MBM7603800.1 LacI family repressor for deo operon, udp, cdd, tsx, nupC, and nupG [Metabacillus crassostreae]